MEKASDLIDTLFESNRDRPTILLVINGAMIFKRKCKLKYNKGLFSFIKSKKEVTDCLKISVSDVVLHVLPDMLDTFLTEVRVKRNITRVLTEDFVSACIKSIPENKPNYCYPVTSEDRLDHAESERNWVRAEPFFLSHEINSHDLHSYSLKSEYKKDRVLLDRDPEVYKYLDNWIENDLERVELVADNSWAKLCFEGSAEANDFKFNSLDTDKADVKAYLCDKSTGRLVKIADEKLLKIPLSSDTMWQS